MFNNSGPLTEMKLIPASLAIALAKRVFPHPGGPHRSTPVGTLMPNSSNSFECRTGAWKLTINSLFARWEDKIAKNYKYHFLIFISVIIPETGNRLFPNNPFRLGPLLSLPPFSHPYKIPAFNGRYRKRQIFLFGLSYGGERRLGKKWT